MTTTRSFCPLDCGWHHDQADFDPSVPQPFASQPAPDGIDPETWGYTLGRALVVEEALKEHLRTHGMLTWVEALATAKQRAEKAETAIQRVREFADQDQDGICRSHIQGDLRRLLKELR